MKIVDFDIPVTASPAVGAPPEGLLAFYWHFIRQTKGWYVAMFGASLAVALLDTVIPLFIGRLVSLMEATDVCFAPVLTMTEAAQHPHNVQRGTFVDMAGTTQPAPAPRFSRTRAEIAMPPAHPGQHTREILRDWGFDTARIDALVEGRAVVAG